MNLSNKSKEILIQSLLLNWYKKNKRDLPWRKIYKNLLPNPYHVFVSEYMLQQTTVGTVKNRFTEFIIKWPSIDALSKISESKILNFWSGLGYYSRAKNLLKAAKLIKKNHKSKIPNNYEDLISLPGIGDYTAKAILGIAFNIPAMPIDANIERIIARLYGMKFPLKEIKKTLSIKSQKLISKKFSNNLIQAFMDYGSIICTPRNPKCKICIIKKYCTSYRENLQNIIPKKNKMKEYLGGCSCDQIRYELLAEPMFTHCCHCHLCQQITGSAFITNTFIEGAKKISLSEAKITVEAKSSEDPVLNFEIVFAVAGATRTISDHLDSAI